MSRAHTDRVLARLDPHARIAELEHENAVLREQRNRLIRCLAAEEASHGFSDELLGRGIRPPARDRFMRNGRVDG